MNYKDNIEWLKSLKQQIGQSQHRDLWHFEQVIDETIENLKPLAKPHGRLIDADYINGSGLIEWQKSIVKAEISQAPTVVEAEVSDGGKLTKGLKP